VASGRADKRREAEGRMRDAPEINRRGDRAKGIHREQ
jgi:hypothetical protein